MPTQYSQISTPVRRLLWWLIGGLLLLGGLSLVASSLLQKKAEQWLAERGLEAQIDYLYLSLPNLRLLARGVELHNAEGRGLRARELMLDYSWLQLLRGRLQLQRAYLDGAYMDLESSPGERGRLWEVGGWALGQGERKDKDLRLLLEWVRLRDSRLCYRHRPQWPTASCVQFGDLHARDFLLTMQRKGDEPLNLGIAAERLRIGDLLIREKNADAVDLALVKLDLSDGIYRKPGNQITADKLSATMFGSCPPERWADALRGLTRLVGHCGTARRLQLAGELQFGFGRGAEVHWHRGSGQGVQLRHRDRRWQNWRAQTLAIDEFSYIRDAHRLAWQRAGASAFDWCAPGLRSDAHHYCVRAGTMHLPEPVTFDWSQGLSVAAGSSRLQQVQLLDVAAGKNRDPITAHRIALGDLSYSGATRILQVEGLDLASASGCIPGQLWQQPDHCVRLAGLHTAEPLQLRFGARKKQLPWGFSSGPLRLAQLRVRRDKSTELELQKLYWQRMNFLGGEEPLLVQDLGLQSLSGCLPEALLPERLRPLCADMSRLDGRGTFAWRGGSDSYLILGQLKLQRLLLADRRGSERGLLLQQLHTGEGFFRRNADGANPWIGDNTAQPSPAASPFTQSAKAADGSEPDSPGAEKGLLPPELARRAQVEAEAAGTGPPDAASPNLQLSELSLSKLQGCLPSGWAALLYKQPQGMPGCFDVLNLRQHSPLAVAWGGGVDLLARQLAVERARARTPGGQLLLQLEQLRLPSARVRHLSGGTNSFVALPHLLLREFSGCLPARVESSPLDIGCADVRDLRLGGAFKLQADSRAVSADLSGSRIEQILLTQRDEAFVAELQQLRAPRLQFLWPRDGKQNASLQLQDFAVAKLRACLPERLQLREGLPRCAESEKLRSSGEAGFALGETLFKAGPVAEPLWRLESVVAQRLALTPAALEVHGLRLRQLLACGLHRLLPASADDLGLADCVTAAALNFSGISRIGLTPEAARVQLGQLASEPIALWQKSGDYTRLGLQRLSWTSLRWNGGPIIRVTDLAVSGFRGCLTGVAGRCVQLRELQMRGTQKVSLAAPFSSSGTIELVDLGIGNPSGESWVLSGIQLDQLSYGGEGQFQLSLAGASGCLPRGRFGDSRLAPCYRLGPVRVRRVERVATARGRISELRGLSIDGAELVQTDYPASARAELLQLRRVTAEWFRFGAGEIAAQQLELDGLASCIPAGYFPRIDHCLSLDSAATSGTYRADSGSLDLPLLALQQLQILDREGRKLVRGEQVAVASLHRDESQLNFNTFEAQGFYFFGRREGAPEYDRHAWNGELRQLTIRQLDYSSTQRQLDIASVEILRPRGILVRDSAGKYPVVERFGLQAGGESRGGVVARAGERVTSELPFNYRIGDMNLDRGTFTWVDRQGQYRARLPVRQINMRVKNASSYADDRPSTVLFNARPGGFGEIQLAGTIDFLATQKWNADLTGYIKNANLIPSTPYMANLLGYKILQGQLDALLNIQVRENKVDAMAQMVLNRIRVRRVRDSDQLPIKPSFIPLGIALELLKDGRGNVRFDMPISGDLYDPKFSFSFIFSELLQRAVMEALFSYFTPLGVYSLSKYAWTRLRAVHFDPIEFEPGSVDLTTKAERQLVEMVETLRERPDARPGICGVATALDWHALHPETTPGMRGSRKARETFYRYPPVELHEELEQLAQRRSRRVEVFLLRAGISADEFIQCAPDYNGRDFDDPRVEFSR